MAENKNVVSDLEIDDTEYRLQEFVYILHQADVRLLNSLLEKKKKKAIKQVKNESSDLSTSQH